MSQENPLVSVIVPTLNRPVELGQALASLTTSRMSTSASSR